MADPSDSPAPDPDPEVEALLDFPPVVRKCVRQDGWTADRRQVRLEGRIVEADFYVRRLTWIEVACDIGGNADELLRMLKRGGVDAIEIAATPVSTLLDRARRAYWQEKGEVDRPPAPEIGEPEDAFGLGPSRTYNSERDGNIKEWERRRAIRGRLNAEAQRAWEERARAEAAHWAERESAKKGGPADPGSESPP